MPPNDDDEEIRIGDEPDDKTPRERPAVVAPAEEITGGQFLFDSIVEVLADVGLETRLKLVAALDDGDWAKAPAEVRKVFEEADALYFDDDE